MANDYIFRLEGADQVLQAFAPIQYRDALEKTADDLASFHEVGAQEKLRERIYQKPASKRYRRTGSANRGRKNERIMGGGRRVLHDSRIGGASRNYSPMLNRNKKIKKLNTLYWDDQVDETRREKSRIFQENILKVLKK